MGIEINFTNNCIQVSAEIESRLKSELHEIGGELVSQIARNSRVDTGQTKGSYEYEVISKSNFSELQVGSNLENAIWEEYGTGEYALHGDGRKGGWYIPAEKLSPKAKSRMKKVVGKNGKVFYFTKGKKPQRPIFKTFTANHEKIKRRLAKVFKESVGG